MLRSHGSVSSVPSVLQTKTALVMNHGGHGVHGGESSELRRTATPIRFISEKKRML